MTPDDPFARRATELLMAVAAGDVGAVTGYDDHVFAFLLDVARRRGPSLARAAAAKIGVAPAAYLQARAADLELLAVEASEVALSRARASSLRFDPARGDGVSWAVGALGAAYFDVARALSGARRIAIEIPTDDEGLEPHLASDHGDPAVTAEIRDGLRRALAQLADDERYIVLARLHYGLSYREIALYHFGDETRTKDVDRVLQRARQKLAAAHREWIGDA